MLDDCCECEYLRPFATVGNSLYLPVVAGGACEIQDGITADPTRATTCDRNANDPYNIMAGMMQTVTSAIRRPETSINPPLMEEFGRVSRYSIAEEKDRFIMEYLCELSESSRYTFRHRRMIVVCG